MTLLQQPEVIDHGNFEYLNHNLLVQGKGKLHVAQKSRLIVCNQARILNNSFENPSIPVGIVIGDPASGGTLHLFEGSELVLQTNSLLKIHDNSRLIIDPGASLRIEPGAKIQLLGKNAVLEINGNLILENNANFTFTSPGVQGGYIEFGGKVLTTGNTSFITLNGANKDDLVLKINGNMHIPETVTRIIVTNGKLTGGFNGGHLDSRPPLVLNNIQSIGTSVSVHGKLGTVIRNCNFSNASIFGNLVETGRMLAVENTKIQSTSSTFPCILINGGGFSLESVQLTGGDAGVEAIGIELPSQISNSSIIGNAEKGISILNSPGGGLTVKNSVVSNNGTVNRNSGTGIALQGASLAVQCGEIKNNDQFGIHLANNATLRMNSSLGSGFVDLSGNKHTILLMSAKLVDINEGFNNLSVIPPDRDAKFPSKHYVITGDMQLPGCLSTSTISAWSNQWNDQNKVPTRNKEFLVTKTSCGPQAEIFFQDPQPEEFDATGCSNITNLPGTCPPNNPGCKQNPLAFCPGCESITTTNFRNAPLNEAVQDALGNTELVDPANGDDIFAIDQLHDILTYQFKKPHRKPRETYLIDLSYEKIKETLGHAFLTEKITPADNIGGLHPSVEQVLSTQHFRIANARNEGDTKTQFYTEMDMAQVYRLIDQRDKSLEVLDNISPCNPLDSIDEVYFRNYRTMVQAEILILTGQEESHQLQALLENGTGAYYPPTGIQTSAIDTVITGRCTGDTIRFVATENADNYQWDFGDCSVTDGKEVSHIFEAPGTYTISLTKLYDCGPVFTTTTITIYPEPDASFSISAPTCSGDREHQFINTSQPLSFNRPICASTHNSYQPLDTTLVRVQYSWDLGETCGMLDNTSPGDTVQCFYGAADTNQITLKANIEVLDTNSSTWIPTDCQSVSGQSIVVTEPLFTFFEFEQIPCAPDTLEFINITTGGIGDINYLWTFNDTDTTSTPDAKRYFAFGDTTEIDLVAIDEVGCTDRLSMLLGVPECPAPPTISLGSDSTLCPDEILTLDAGPGFTNYQWSNGSTGQTLTVNTSDTYYVTATASNGTLVGDTIEVTFAPITEAIKITDAEGPFAGVLNNGDRFGRSISPAGDIDNNGVTDLAIGAHLTDDGGTDKGAVYIMFMNPDKSLKGFQKISEGHGGFTGTFYTGEIFGISVAPLSPVGDFDGDGVEDIVVGAERDNDGGRWNGAVWLLFLNTDGTVKGHQKISATSGNLTAPLGGTQAMGSDVDNLGDFDGDGVTDLLVGSRRDHAGGSFQGSVYILYLNPDGTVKAHSKISEVDGGFTGQLDNEDFFGGGVANLGDLDKDGITDIAVGAYRDDDGGDSRGAVWILFLNADGTVKSHQKISNTEGNFTGPLANSDFFGIDVHSPGDLNADGYPDLMVGALSDFGGTNRGAIYILYLNPDGTVQSHDIISSLTPGMEGKLVDGDNMGVSVNYLGDIDGDGRPEIAAGANGDNTGGFGHGAAWLLTWCADVQDNQFNLRQTTTATGQGQGQQDLPGFENLKGFRARTNLSIHPNPSNRNQVTVQFTLEDQKPVTIRLFDLTGKEMERIEQRTYSEGQHNASFDLDELKNGIYFVHLIMGNERIVEKLFLMR